MMRDCQCVIERYAVARRFRLGRGRRVCGGRMLRRVNNDILSGMRYLVLLLSLIVSPAAVAADSPLILSASEWAIPRSGDSVLHMAAVSQAMRRLDAQSGSRLVIRYPGGDEGSLWANELQAWLVSLGLASKRIERIPGSGDPQRIELSVLSPATLPGGS